MCTPDRPSKLAVFGVAVACLQFGYIAASHAESGAPAPSASPPPVNFVVQDIGPCPAPLASRLNTRASFIITYVKSTADKFKDIRYGNAVGSSATSFASNHYFGTYTWRRGEIKKVSSGKGETRGSVNVFGKDPTCDYTMANGMITISTCKFPSVGEEEPMFGDIFPTVTDASIATDDRRASGGQNYPNGSWMKTTDTDSVFANVQICVGPYATAIEAVPYEGTISRLEFKQSMGITNTSATPRLLSIALRDNGVSQKYGHYHLWAFTIKASD